MRRSQSKEFFCILLAVVLWTPGAGLADQPPPLTLQDFMSLALKYNPGVVASQAQRDAARAGERTAAAYPNPTIEAGAGPSFYKDGREGMDGNWAFGVSQPIDYPALRSFRIQGARAGTGSAQAGLQAFQITLLADVKAAFYDVIRTQCLAALLAFLLVPNRAVVIFVQLIEPDVLLGIDGVVNPDGNGNQGKPDVSFPD